MDDGMLIILDIFCPPLVRLIMFWLQEKPRFGLRALLLTMSAVALFLGLMACTLRK